MKNRKFINENLVLDNRGRISWINSIGKIFSIIYENEKYTFIVTKYNKENQKVHFKYYQSDNETDYSMMSNNIVRCAIGNVIGKYNFDYKYKIGDLVNSNKIIGYSKIKYGGKYRKSYYVECINDEYKREISENSLDNGCTCPVCTNRIIVKGKNDLWTTKPDIAKLLKNPDDGYKYSTGSGKYLLWECPDCKNIVRARIPDVIYNNGKLRCNQCSDGFSYPEKLMVNIFRYLGIDFKHHIKLENKGFMFKNRFYNPEYDFLVIINNRKILVEMDGNFHNRPHIHSSMTIDDIKYIDSQKDKLAIENGYEIIRIDCTESEYDYIISSLRKSELNHLIDLKSLNKVEINSKAYSSLLVESCHLYMTKTKNLNTISKIMDIPYKRVQVYLSKGSKIGLCDYSPAFSMKNKGKLDFVGTYEFVL